MYKKVIFYYLILIQSICQGAETIPVQTIPSLKFITWKTIVAHADSYEHIPDCFQNEIEQALLEFESIDDDPFVFLQLTYALGASKQVDQAIRYIALWLYRVSSGKTHDVLQRAELTQKITALPMEIRVMFYNRQSPLRK